MDLGLVIGGIFTAGVTALALAGNLGKAKPKLTHPWEVPPTVRIVVGGADGCTEGVADLVESCVARWGRAGAKVSKVIRGLEKLPDGREMRGDDHLPLPSYGSIVVCFGTTPDFEPNHLAKTYYSSQGTTTEWAICQIGAPSKLVITHELGHALGFRDHVSKKGHILYATSDRIGDNFDGIRDALGKKA